MKKLFTILFLLVGLMTYSQTPKYLTENNIQFSIVLKEGQWTKHLDDKKEVSFVYMLSVRNENFIPFMQEVNKVLTFYGFEYPTETYSTDNTDYQKYDSYDYKFSIYGDNNYRYPNELSQEERTQLIYSYLTGDRFRLETYKSKDVEIALSISKNLFLLRFLYPKQLNKKK